jgi:hypothetical protein
MATPASTRAQWGVLAAILAVLAGAPATTVAAGSGWEGGVQLVIAPSLGDLRQVFGTGFGIEAVGFQRLDATGLFGVRVTGGLIDYGSEDRSVPLAGGGPSIGVQVNTKRIATTVGVGPQFSWPHGRLRPYAWAIATAAYFNSQADLSGRDSAGIYRVLTADLNRFVVGAGAGGGLGFRVTESVHLDAGLEYRRYRDVRTIGNGAAELPNGDVFMTENRGDLGMLVVRLGVRLAIPAGRGGAGPRGGPRGG